MSCKSYFSFYLDFCRSYSRCHNSFDSFGHLLNGSKHRILQYHNSRFIFAFGCCRIAFIRCQLFLYGSAIRFNGRYFHDLFDGCRSRCWWWKMSSRTERFHRWGSERPALQMIMLKFIIAIYLYYRWSDLIFRYFLNGMIPEYPEGNSGWHQWR